MTALMSGAGVSLTLASVALAAFLALWIVRLVTAERYNGATGGTVARDRGISRLDVGLIGLAVVFGLAAAARMLYVLGILR